MNKTMNKTRINIMFNGDKEENSDGGSEYYSHTTWSFDGARINPPTHLYGNVSEPFLIDNDWLDQTLYAVYYVYSTGDSFGSAENDRLEVVGVYNNIDNAKKIQKAIQDNKKDSNINVIKDIKLKRSIHRHTKVILKLWSMWRFNNSR